MYTTKSPLLKHIKNGLHPFVHYSLNKLF